MVAKFEMPERRNRDEVTLPPEQTGDPCHLCGFPTPKAIFREDTSDVVCHPALFICPKHLGGGFCFTTAEFEKMKASHPEWEWSDDETQIDTTAAGRDDLAALSEKTK